MIAKKMIFAVIGTAFFLVFTIDKNKRENLVLGIKKRGKIIVVIVPLIMHSLKPAHAIQDYTPTLKIRLLNHRRNSNDVRIEDWKTIPELQNELSNKKEDLEELQEQLNRINKKRSHLKKKIKKLEIEIDAYETQIQVIENEQNEKSEFSEQQEYFSDNDDNSSSFDTTTPKRGWGSYFKGLWKKK